MLVYVLSLFLNVILSTVHSLATIKGTPVVASLISAIYYGFYTYIIVLTATGDLPLMYKIIITFGVNLVGVFIVKFIEKKLTKDKLWKIDFTVNKLDFKPIENKLKELNIPYYYNELGKHCMISVFANTQKESSEIAKLVKAYGGKYFISENKGILE